MLKQEIIEFEEYEWDKYATLERKLETLIETGYRIVSVCPRSVEAQLGFKKWLLVIEKEETAYDSRW